MDATKVMTAGAVVAALIGTFALNAPSPSTMETRTDALMASAIADRTAIGTSEAPPAAKARTTTDPTAVAGAVVMGESSGQRLGGWAEVGRVSARNGDGSRYGEMHHLQSIGDRLVVIGSTSRTSEGPSRDLVYTSVDGVTWIPAAVPGAKPKFTDLASAGDHLVLGGDVRVNGTRRARLWTSSDGLTWRTVAVPRNLKGIDQIVSAGSPLAVRAGRRLWAKQDGAAWASVTKLIDMSILHGPGGFLASRFPDRILLHWGDDLSQISEVPLPRRMGRNPALLADAQLFALDDAWLLVPHVATNPDTIYTSADGLEWSEIPRPPGILAGAVRWMTDVGDEVQAFGAVDGDAGTRVASGPSCRESRWPKPRHWRAAMSSSTLPSRSGVATQRPA